MCIQFKCRHTDVFFEFPVLLDALYLQFLLTYRRYRHVSFLQGICIAACYADAMSQLWQRCIVSVRHIAALCQNDASQVYKIFTNRSLKYSSIRIRNAFPEIRNGSPRLRALNERGVQTVGYKSVVFCSLYGIILTQLTVRADIQKTSVNTVWGPNGPQVLRLITTPFLHVVQNKRYIQKLRTVLH